MHLQQLALGDAASPGAASAAQLFGGGGGVAAPAAALLRGRVSVQLDGKGVFVPCVAELWPEQLRLHLFGEDTPWRVASTAGLSTRPTKKARAGHPWAFRVDLASTDEVQADHATPYEPSGHEPQPEPPAAAAGGGGWYRVVCKSVVRAGVAMDSKKIGMLEPGELVPVAGRVVGGILASGGRLERWAGGWVSETASDGTALLEKSKPPVRTDAKMPLLKGAAVYTCSACRWAARGGHGTSESFGVVVLQPAFRIDRGAPIDKYVLSVATADTHPSDTHPWRLQMLWLRAMGGTTVSVTGS